MLNSNIISRSLTEKTQKMSFNERTSELLLKASMQLKLNKSKLQAEESYDEPSDVQMFSRSTTGATESSAKDRLRVNSSITES